MAAKKSDEKFSAKGICRAHGRFRCASCLPAVLAENQAGSKGKPSKK